MAESLEGLSQESIAELAALAKTLSNNPKTRSHFLGLMKLADPGMNIPEIDIPMRVGEAFKPALDRLEKLEKENAEREARNMVMQRRDAVIKKGIATEDDIPEIEKLMLEKGISSHETAAEFYRSQKKAAAPTPGSFGAPLVPKPDLKAMGGNINNWARAEANKTIAELISKRSA